MAELKTRPTAASVDGLLEGIADDRKREDCRALAGIMRQITGEEPKLWGASIVGFGNYHYVYESGREGDWFLTGFAPRKQDLTLYIMPGFEKYPDLMKKLGRYRTGRSCLYIKSLEDVDQTVLKELIKRSVKDMIRAYVLARTASREKRAKAQAAAAPRTRSATPGRTAFKRGDQKPRFRR